MGTFFTVLAFVTALGLVVPLVGAVSPFSASVITPNTYFTPNILGQQVGCTTKDSSGNFSCSSGANAASSPSFFGVTQFIFGNFFAALNYLVSMSVAIFIPASYVVQWLGGPNPTALAIAGLVQALVMIAYSNDFFYILSGRWIFPP